MGFVMMFDLTSEQSFKNVRLWLEQLKQHAFCDQPDIILCGNKADLASKRAISWQRANSEASKYELQYFETSAASGENVARAIEALVELVLVRMNKVVQNSAANALYSDTVNLIGPVPAPGANALDGQGPQQGYCWCS